MLEQHLLSYAVGIFIIFASHIYILYSPNTPLTRMQTHSYMNIVAAMMVAYYFLFKEHYIDF